MKFVHQLFPPTADEAPCPRGEEVRQRELSPELDAACERCLSDCVASALEDEDLLDPQAPGWLAAVRARAIDLYCLLSLADAQQGRPQ